MITYAIRMEFRATNNDSEYEALIAGLRIAKELEVTKLNIFCDSKLVVNQVTGKFQAKSARLILYLKKVKELLNDFDHYSISHIPRSENQQADKLAKMASSDDPEETGLAPVEVLRSPSIDQMEIDPVLETEPER